MRPRVKPSSSDNVSSEWLSITNPFSPDAPSPRWPAA